MSSKERPVIRKTTHFSASTVTGASQAKIQNIGSVSSDCSTYSEYIAEIKIKYQTHVAQLEEQSQKLSLLIIENTQSELATKKLKEELADLNKEIYAYYELLRAREILPDPSNMHYSSSHKIHPTEWEKFSEEAIKKKG